MQASAFAVLSNICFCDRVLILSLSVHFQTVRRAKFFLSCYDEPFNFRRYAIAVLLLNLAARFVVRERKI